jgi:Kef-type K+ transport system membrane component KefB
MENILVLMVLTYGVSLGFGFLLQRYLKIPWEFAALFFGIILSAFGFFRIPLESEAFNLLATLGMLFLLFIIGFDMDLKKLKELSKYIFLGALLITSMGGLFGSLLLYFVFPAEVSNSFFVALITGFSFATVGEAVLMPILAQFRAVDTTFGQLTLGIGTLDDIIEVLMLAAIAALPTFMPQAQVQSLPDPLLVVLALSAMFLLALTAAKLGNKLKDILRKNSEESYVPLLLVFVLFFSFAALGGYIFEGLAAVGAILGGIVTRELLPKEILKEDEKFIDFLGYVFLSPLFFLSVGAKVSLASLFVYPLLIILVIIIANGSKLLATLLLFPKLLGHKYSLLMGLGLCVRFSTSLIIQIILLNSGLISLTLYSVLVASAILTTLSILGIYSWSLSRGPPP